ncbi:hypothetical protein Taro_000489 [Colocasia esculenta]|uniref:Uncharacterized protein n=1 Tax=Colocasia esculenta TaxID=4460 RepID=A0A843TGN0_COLES|nr:hypothetical protein [Colocasia esculenta]
MGAIGLKPKVRPISFSRPFRSFSPLTSSLTASRCFSLLTVLVLRRGRAVRAGVVLAACGARRRSSFLREGHNGFVLRGFPERLFRNPARLVTRSSRRPRSCRGGAPDRDMVATLLCVASGSRPAWASRHGEFSQQRQGARRAEGMGRRSPGARHLRACPVREVVTVTWDPRPREPVEGVLRATSVLELAATWADSGAEGKTVSFLSSGRARVGRRGRGGSRGLRS